MSRAVVRAINSITESAYVIANTGDLSKRIDASNTWGDLHQVALVLNTFLNKIERLMTGGQRTIDSIAHDMRTPLTRIRNQIALLRRDAPNVTGDKIYESCGDVLNEIDHALATFTSLLRITRLESGSQTLSRRMLSLKELMEDVCELYEPVAEDKGIELLCEIDEILVEVDRDLLFQALANVMDNALKFTPKLGKVHAWAYQNADKNTCLVIEDNGPGLEDGEVEKVFDRFYRGDFARKSTGSGLGLNLVAAIAKAHDIRLHIANRDPHGMRFTLVFPKFGREHKHGDGAVFELD